MKNIFFIGLLLIFPFLCKGQNAPMFVGKQLSEIENVYNYKIEDETPNTITLMLQWNSGKDTSKLRLLFYSSSQDTVCVYAILFLPTAKDISHFIEDLNSDAVKISERHWQEYYPNNDVLECYFVNNHFMLFNKKIYDATNSIDSLYRR